MRCVNMKFLPSSSYSSFDGIHRQLLDPPSRDERADRGRGEENGLISGASTGWLANWLYEGRAKKIRRF